MLPADEIKEMFQWQHVNDGIRIIHDGQPICWWIRKSLYPMKIGTTLL